MPVFILCCARPIALLFACFCALPAHAGVTGESHATLPLSLTEALQRAESRHPLIQSWRARLAAADARTLQAGMRPPPELNLEVEDVLGSGAWSGTDSAQTTLGFSQLIERGDLRDRRVEAAHAGHRHSAIQAEIALLELRAEVARRFVHVLSDQLQLGITLEATALARDTHREVVRRVEAARTPQAELSRASVTLARAEIEQEHAEHDLLSSRRHLAAATGSVEVDFGEAEGELLDLPPVADFESLLARIQETPDVLQFVSQARLRESELRLAQARRTPGLRLGAGLRRLEASDDVGLVFSASMPLFAAARQRGNVAEAEARIAQVGPDREQAWLKVQAQLHALWQELNHAGTEVQMQRERVVPAVEEALEQTLYAYKRGRYSLLELRDAQAEWAAQRRRLIQAAAEYHGYLIEIQRLTGTPAARLSSNDRSQP